LLLGFPWPCTTDQNDVYPDIRNDYKQSEVAVDYNAGFTGAAAGLAFLLNRGDLSSCGAGRSWTTVPISTAGSKALVAVSPLP